MSEDRESLKKIEAEFQVAVRRRLNLSPADKVKVRVYVTRSRVGTYRIKPYIDREYALQEDDWKLVAEAASTCKPKNAQAIFKILIAEHQVGFRGYSDSARNSVNRHLKTCNVPFRLYSLDSRGVDFPDKVFRMYKVQDR